MLIFSLVLLVPIGAYGQCSDIGCCPGLNSSCNATGCFCDESCLNLGDCCQDYIRRCLDIHECSEIDSTNGRLSCGVDVPQNSTHACRLTCDDGFTEYYTCNINGKWNKEPVLCAEHSDRVTELVTEIYTEHSTDQVTGVYQEEACANYDHPNYGCQGRCMYTASCPGSKFVPGLCPTQADGVECCFTGKTDPVCATRDHVIAGEVGHCVPTCQCTDAYYVYGLCPNEPFGVECCFKKPTGTCSKTRQELACAIKKHHDNKRATLLHDNYFLNSLGKNDGASALDNIVDTCNGGEAKRSSYLCREGTAPGGSVNLSTSVLEYILGLLDDGYNLKINVLAGACHEKTSRHYLGTAVNLQIRYADPYQDWMDRCDSLCAAENFGPGKGHHSIHTHCAFSS